MGQFGEGNGNKEWGEQLDGIGSLTTLRMPYSGNRGC
jgi:hypothetical protein